MSDGIAEIDLPLSGPRRALAVGVSLALVVALAALARAAGLSGAGLLAGALAVLAGLNGLALLRLPAVPLRLAGAGLLAADGRMVATLDNIAALRRGPFALKPSGGVALILHRPVPARWVPGAFWALGRRIGIGGVLARPAIRQVEIALSLHQAGQRNR
jgi:hypothetical protein